MGPVGVICEYNPFHNGHSAQLERIRADFGPETAIVCLMSGNYVQRGEPAIFPKQLRAEAAVRCGADLVLELPLTAALSSAEGFASRGVEILTALGCEGLSFGSECGDRNILMSTARANLDPAFDALVRTELETGCSYPTARRRALERLVGSQTPAYNTLGARSERSQSLPLAGKVTAPPALTDEVVSRVSALYLPNDILAVEYCKAILRQGSPMLPLPIRRPGAYHAETLDPEAPSATALRAVLEKAFSKAFPQEGGCPGAHTGADEGMSRISWDAWRSAVPSCLRELYASASIHTMAAGERAVLAILRTLPDAAFETLPFGSEGLWSKLMKNCRACATVGEIADATKSKRYTLSRIRRMLLCAVLGLTEADLGRRPPYVRILAFNDRGRGLLREMKPRFTLVNAGEIPPDTAYYALETRAADLYSLFSAEAPRPAGEESRLRVRYIPIRSPE